METLASTRLSVNYGARTIAFSKGQFYETFQALPGARIERKKIEAGEAARRLVSWNSNLDKPGLREFTRIEEKFLGLKSFPEAYRVICETYSVEA